MKPPLFQKRMVFLLFLFAVMGGTASAEELGTYFVEAQAPGSISNTHPKNDPQFRPFFEKQFETADYEMDLTFPIERRDSSVYGDFMMHLEIRSKKDKVMHFKFKKWELRSSMGKGLEGMLKRLGDPKIHGTAKVSEFVGKDFRPRYAFPQEFEFFYDIPKMNKDLMLEFTLELFDSAGKPQTVSQKIPLKRASFKR